MSELPNVAFVHRLPQSGWVLSSELAEAVDISGERVIEWLRDFRIPHRRLGTRVFVNMDEFFANLPAGSFEPRQAKESPPAKAKPKPVAKRGKP